jgi:hypothetical protein
MEMERGVFMNLFLVVLLSSGLSWAAPMPKAKPLANRLICKTAADKKSPKLYFTYNVPFLHEPEDPTMPYGRQTMVLAGRPIVQLFFDRSPQAAGENGEQLQPGQCAFAKRALRGGEPSQVQILLPPGQVQWISQPIGMKNPAVLTPPGDWTFLQEPERVFWLNLDDPKNFITSHMPN